MNSKFLEEDLNNKDICKDCATVFKHTLITSPLEAQFRELIYYGLYVLWLFVSFLSLSLNNFIVSLSIFIGLFLLIQIIYIPRHIRKQFLHNKTICPKCKSTNIIPINTPIGHELYNKYYN